MHSALVDLRSYSEEKPQEYHGFVQIVLPVSGQLEIDVAGLQERLSPARGIFIPHGSRHSQRANAANRSLVVDVDANRVRDDILDRFSDNPIIELTERTFRLIRHMTNVINGDECDEEAAVLWSQMLLNSLISGSPDIISRLLTLKTLVEIDPFQPWTVERMAQQAEVSASHLHLLFREHFEKTPHGWLADARMRKISALLSQTSLSIAEIADRAGFSDQTALTRAMKKALGTTPAAYRRNRFS